MFGRRNRFVAREGLPLLVATAVAAIGLLRFSAWWHAVVAAIVFAILYLVFRDPRRRGPSVALGVVSPVDGEVLAVDRIDAGELGKAVHKIRIRIDALGTYTARSPVEGHIMDHHGPALWVQTDEGDDVVLKFSGYRFGLAPRAFARYGERLGQGQRFAYLRLTRIAEVEMPLDGKVGVEPGQLVVAGVDLLGTVPVPR